MINERQEQLKKIISELKKPLAPQLHQIRDLPGGGKWVYISWQTMRERLDQVCPDWTLDYSEITTIENHAFCRCGLTILDVRKTGTTLTATLWHVASGEMLESAYDLTVFMETSHKKMNKAQLVGSATTYAKKIALCGLLNLDTQDADPGLT